MERGGAINHIPAKSEMSSPLTTRVGVYIITSRQISITWSNHLRDAFPTELIKLSPPNLVSLELRGCGGLTRLVLSPASACPKLSSLDLSACGALAHVLLQSASLDTVLLSKCTHLGKALVHAKCLRQVRALCIVPTPTQHTVLKRCCMHTPEPPRRCHTASVQVTRQALPAHMVPEQALEVLK
jgi:hypothetical protein